METTTVEEMAAAFKQMGASFIVGHPGGESVELMEAAKARGIWFILMKQEVAGAMLAATLGEITGSPGVCLSTRGPGVTNMVNGIAHAFLDRAPLIAITDRYSNQEQEIGLRQRLDHKAILQPIVKWSTTIDATIIKQQLRRALRVSTAYAPGPVHFDLPQSETKNLCVATKFVESYTKLLSAFTKSREFRNRHKDNKKRQESGTFSWFGYFLGQRMQCNSNIGRTPRRTRINNL